MSKCVFDCFAMFNTINFDRLNPTWRSAKTASVSVPTLLPYHVSVRTRPKSKTLFDVASNDGLKFETRCSFKRFSKKSISKTAMTARGESDMRLPKAAVMGNSLCFPVDERLKRLDPNFLLYVSNSHTDIFTLVFTVKSVSQ